MTTTTTRTSAGGRGAILTAALTVATAASVATAHGLYQVAAASRVPTSIAWLYPVITDGLALVAYTATARLHHGGRRYAAGIVVLAAGLSGLAQAVYLAGGIAATSAAPVGLRFGVGAWPAVAAALTAHLLHLISTDPTPEDEEHRSVEAPSVVEERSAFNPPYNPALYNPASNPAVQPRTPEPRTTPPVQPAGQPPRYTPPAEVNATGPASAGAAPRERARAAARRHRDAHGELPTVTELVALAKVARGTAAKALRELRAERRALHVVTTHPDQRTNQ
jgi:hypothetical protein